MNSLNTVGKVCGRNIDADKCPQISFTCHARKERIIVLFQEDLLETNRIVTNTRIAMYSLHMVLTPVQGELFHRKIPVH